MIFGTRDICFNEMEFYIPNMGDKRHTPYVELGLHTEYQLKECDKNERSREWKNRDKQRMSIKYQAVK